MKTQIEYVEELKPCPLCYDPTATYDDRYLKPKSAMMTMGKQSHAKYWVECMACETRTRGHKTQKAAALLWNHRHGEELAAKQRNKMVLAALDSLQQLDYHPEEVIDQPDTGFIGLW